MDKSDQQTTATEMDFILMKHKKPRRPINDRKYTDHGVTKITT